MIPDDQVDEVRARADIVQVIGDIVPLKKSGKDYKACCPFHDEKTPSFYVVPAKGFYNCFGCGESGDVFAFLTKHHGLSFVDAVKHVAAASGVEIREVSRGQTGEDPFRHLYEANAFARMFFQDSLWDEATGGPATAYLEERGIDRETAERFEIGYAPDAWRGLLEAASHHGIGEEVLIEVGLVTRSEKRKDSYDRFRGRLIFPIESLAGKVVGFGGRVLGAGREGTPKYVNSPESPIYHKGGILYGLSWAKNAIRRRETALMVEGYMDVVSLAVAGFDNAVAPLGTAVTSDQVALLHRFTSRIDLLFDGDAAGLKATFKAADLLLAGSVHPCVVTLPPGEDPDTIVHSEGAEALKGYIDGAIDVLDRKIQMMEKHDHFKGSEHRRTAIDRLLPTLRAVQDPVLRDIYIKKVSDCTEVRPDTLEAELARVASVPQQQQVVRPRDQRRTSAPDDMGPERLLLLLMTKDRDWIEKVGERLGPRHFVDVRYRAVFEALLADHDLTHPPEGMVPEAARVLDKLLADPEELGRGHRVFKESVSKILSTSLQGSLDEVTPKLQNNTLDEQEETELLLEIERLSKERRDLGQDWSPTAKRLSKDNHLRR
ncbi:MAG: DNA primase [Gemmatimonadetes bacterium]|nr:DNA primase [Gemmatimonadota bacterium]